MKRLHIAMVAPAWLTVPAQGYGGTESVIDNLCRGLDETGVHVEFFGVEGSRTPAQRYHWTYQTEQYEHLNDPMFDAASIPLAHLLECLERIQRRGKFDLIHDHNTLFGPAVFAGRDDLPPVLHTLHGAFSSPERLAQGWNDTDPMFTALAKSKKLYFNAISRSQANLAPMPLRKRIVAAIHHGIDVASHRVYTQKDGYFVNVGRIAADKGIHVAADVAARLGSSLKLGGVVAGMCDVAQIKAELGAAASRFAKKADFAYFRDYVAPQWTAGAIDYLGPVGGQAKDELIGRAKAFLMPVQWDEPFGVAVLDALVVGTPVVAMRRGSMPEIIEHGVNGFLANTPEEFARYAARVDEIDPAACRRSVEERFSYQVMTRHYLDTYERVVARHAPTPALSLKSSPLGMPYAGQAFYEKLSKAASKTKQALSEDLSDEFIGPQDNR
ncbi:MAG TPA: glycosyltransferase [Candidatus Saccharimonadia bacterium]